MQLTGIPQFLKKKLAPMVGKSVCGSTQKETELRLINQVKSGSQKAVKAWYEQYQSSIRRYIASKISSENDIDELVQDTFLSALKSISFLRGDSTITTWMIGIARHEVADFYRKKYAKKALQILSLDELIPDGTVCNADETDEKVMQTLLHLTQEHRNLLLLKYSEGYSIKEIAQICNKTVKSVEAELYRARQAFKQEYALDTIY